MTAVGYLSGAFVLKAGDTMTGDLVLPGDPDQPLEAATKQYVDNSGGGGGAVSSVFGRTGVVVAVSGDYPIALIPGLQSALDAKADETVTLTAGIGLSGGGDLSASRTFDVDYGNTAGTAAEGDDPRLSDDRFPLPHNTTHFVGGTDPLTADDVDADPVGSAAAALAAAQAYVDARLWLHTESPLLTGGNIVVPNSGSPTQIHTDLTLPALAGETIAVGITCLVNPAGGELYWNAATIVSGVPVTYFGNATGTWPFPLGGISGWFCNVDDFTSPRGERKLKLGAQDVSGGTVTVRIYAQADNNPRTVRGDAGQPLQTYIVNQRLQS